MVLAKGEIDIALDSDNKPDWAISNEKSCCYIVLVYIT